MHFISVVIFMANEMCYLERLMDRQAYVLNPSEA